MQGAVPGSRGFRTASGGLPVQAGAGAVLSMNKQRHGGQAASTVTRACMGPWGTGPSSARPPRMMFLALVRPSMGAFVGLGGREEINVLGVQWA